MTDAQGSERIEVPAVLDQEQVDFYVTTAIWPCQTF